MEKILSFLRSFEAGKVSGEQVAPEMARLGIDALVRVEKRLVLFLRDQIYPLHEVSGWAVEADDGGAVYVLEPGLYAALGLFPDEQGRKLDLHFTTEDGASLGGLEADDLRQLQEDLQVSLVAGRLS